MIRIHRVMFLGRPDPVVEVPPDAIGGLDQLIDQIEGGGVALDAPTLSCWPITGKQPLYLFDRGDGRLVFVSDTFAEFIDGARSDPQRRLARAAEDAFRRFGAVRPRKLDRSTCILCTAGDYLGPLWSCPCDTTVSGIDLRDWNHYTTLLANNCYSFARRTRWCDTPGDGGSHPGGDVRLSALEGLEKDKVVPVAREVVLSTAGEFIGLFLKASGDFHFLRLDGDNWVHKPGKLPAIACDAGKQLIPRGELESASIPEFTFVSYFEITAETPALRHCF